MTTRIAGRLVRAVGSRDHVAPRRRRRRHRADRALPASSKTTLIGGNTGIYEARSSKAAR
jgi:hypothetical protein